MSQLFDPDHLFLYLDWTLTTDFSSPGQVDMRTI